MTPRELTSLAKALGGVVRNAVDELRSQFDGVMRGFSEELARIEQRIASIPAGKDGRDGIDGKDGAPGAIGERGEKGEKGDVGEPGARGDIGEPGARGEKGEKGDPGEAGVRGEKGEKGDVGEPGARGERGEKGEKGDVGEPGARGEKGEKGDPGEPGPAGRDGVDGKSVTLSDVLLPLADALRPEIKTWFDALPKPADGKPGRDGADGKSVTLDDVSGLLDTAVNKWALEFERRAQDTLQRAIDRIPAPKDGRDGADGLGFEDMEMSYDGERTFTFKFARGEIVKQFNFDAPVMIYRGIWKEGAYKRGDVVTWGGSTWHAKQDTNAKPDDASAWVLIVKKGRDGRDGEKGVKGEPGQNGRDGADLTKIGGGVY